MEALPGAGQCTVIALSASVASNHSFAGQTGQLTPSGEVEMAAILRCAGRSHSARSGSERC